MPYQTINLSVRGELLQFVFRAHSKGDQGVVRQVFKQNCYDVTHWYQGKVLIDYYKQHCSRETLLIVDAGGNIGASVVYFLNFFPDAFVYAIEPDYDNWSLLQKNTTGQDRVLNYHGALASYDGTVKLIDPGLSDWGFRTVAGDQQAAQSSPTVGVTGLEVPSISVDSLLKCPRLSKMTPFILKIDIEGAESDVFANESGWMRRFPLVIIELHDWMLPFSGSSKSFLKAVAKYDFDFVYRGENIFLFNRDILKSAP